MTTNIVGVGFAFDPGDIAEWPDDEAIRLVSAGFAVPVDEVAIERAVLKPAVEKRPKLGLPGTK